MANGFQGPPAVDFYNQLSGLGDTLQANAALRQRQQINAVRQAAFSDFTALDPGSPDYGKQALTVAQKLGSAGDQDGALKFLTLAQTAAEKAKADARDSRDFSFRQTESQRAQSNADRSFKITEQNAEKPQYRTIKDASGNDQIIAIDSEGKPKTVEVPGSATGTATNPFSYGGKMNEAQSKDSGYANRMFRAEGVLRDPKVIEAGKSIYETGVERAPVLPEFAKNWLHSPEYQKYDQAGRDFINAVLRRESGAAISQSEFENAYKQYLPRPNDSPERLAEKQKNRQDTLASIAGGGGPNYRPQFTFGPNGELVPTGAPKQGETPALQAPAQKSGAKSVATQEEYAALPRGALYTAPDGTQRVKR